MAQSFADGPFEDHNFWPIHAQSWEGGFNLSSRRRQFAPGSHTAEATNGGHATDEGRAKAGSAASKSSSAKDSIAAAAAVINSKS
ncbi:hypothetical protein PI125_g2570 [Phytophthora idaei]|nr:hypothetical protein PI125_g2570 [Phytophthora idaei]